MLVMNIFISGTCPFEYGGVGGIGMGVGMGYGGNYGIGPAAMAPGMGYGMGMGTPYSPPMAIPGLGYDPYTYENNFLVEMDPNAIIPNNTNIIPEPVLPGRSPYGNPYYQQSPYTNPFMGGMYPGMSGMNSGMGGMYPGMGGVPPMSPFSVGSPLTHDDGDLGGSIPDISYNPNVIQPQDPSMIPYRGQPYVSIQAMDHGMGFRSQAKIEIEKEGNYETQTDNHI